MSGALTVRVGRFGPTPLGRARTLDAAGRRFLEVRDGPFYALYEDLGDGSFRKTGEFRRSYEAHLAAIEEVRR